MKILKKYIWIIVFSCTMISLFGQDSTYKVPDIASVIYLDSFVVTAYNNGLNIDDLIQKVITDTTFYTAFKNIRTLDYISDNTFINIDHEDVFYESQGHQIIKDNKRYHHFNFLNSKHFFKKNGDYKYYTAEIFDKLFFLRDTINLLNKSSLLKLDEDHDFNKSKLHKYKEELKNIIFKPGQGIDVPLMKRKTKIFSKHMAHLYEYSMHHEELDNIDCIVFQVSAKQPRLGKTVIKKLTTYFTTNNFHIYARSLSLSHNNFFYNFDVVFNIKLMKIDDIYVPQEIFYKGNWKIPFKKKENFRVQSVFKYK